MNVLVKVYNKLLRTFYRALFNSPQLEMLLSHEDDTIRKVGKVLKDVLDRSLTHEELEISEEIELLRKKLIREGRKIQASNEENGDLDSVSYLARVVSKKKKWGQLLMKLVSKNNARSGLEFGTCIGISTIYQAKGMSDGMLISLEGLHSRRILAEENLKSLDIDNVRIHEGFFGDTLPKVLKEQGTFDYVFLDGDHRHAATVENFQKILPYLKENSIVVIDDIMWSDGMKKAWSEIKLNPKVYCVIDLFVMGIVVIGDKKEKVESKIALW